jgi:asparagine synthase (glutamine-hydrolysing)
MRGHIFRSQTDTEVIIHAYEEYGIECLQQFNGMFAFALWDASKKCLYLGRDRLGIKPLFYSYGTQKIVFASEIKGILEYPGVTREIELTALHHFLSLNYVPAPWTLFKGISQVLPGHYLVVAENGTMTEHEYWDLVYSAETDISQREWVARISVEIQAAVTRQMVSDVPIGVFLSGGLDSIAVTSSMCKSTNEPVRAFSIGFEEPSYNELNYAKLAAHSFDCTHFEHVAKSDAADVLSEIVWHAEEPTADSSMVPLYHLARIASGEVKVVLTGDGGDEVFGGYPTYQAPLFSELYRSVPGFVRSHLIQPLVNRLPVSDRRMSLDFLLKRFVKGAELDPWRAHIYWRTILDESTKHELYTSDIRAEMLDLETMSVFESYFSRVRNQPLLNQLLYVDLKAYLPNDMLVKVDRMTMAFGLEARVPLLDHQLIELMAQVPLNYKFPYRYKLKSLLRKALQGKVPSHLLARGKQGFNVPKGVWLKKQLRPLVGDLLLGRNGIQQAGLFRQGIIQEMVQSHWAGERDNSHQIWGLLVLSLWWDQFMETK